MQRCLGRIFPLLSQVKKNLLKLVFVVFAMFLVFPGVGGKLEASATNLVNSAQDVYQKTQTEKQQLLEWNGILEVISKAIYFIVWPLIALAGLAMDNTIVYGSFMYLDVPLWKIWTIVRNLCYFMLGFLFLFAVLLYALNPWGKLNSYIKDVSSPQDLIKKMLLAGVGIQLSWFVMMVFVDISTILTYTVGALPSSLLPQSDMQADYKVMGMSIAVDMGDTKTSSSDAFKYYWTLGEKNIAPCVVWTLSNVSSGSGETKIQNYIGGRQFDAIGSGAMQKKMEEGYCFYQSDLFAYVEWNKEGGAMPISGANWQSQNTFEKKLAYAATLIVKSGHFSPNLLMGGYLVDPLAPRLESVQGGSNNDCKVGRVSNKIQATTDNQAAKEFECIYKENGSLVSELIKKTKSRTGPFVALFSSMLDFASFDNNNQGLAEKFIVLVMNSAFALVLLLPLVALVVVLLWRVLMLWIAIALSPFLVLKHFVGGMFDKRGDKLDFLNISEIFKLLFAPVWVGFAVSISLMFMAILRSGFAPNVWWILNQEQQQEQLRLQQERIREATGIEVKQDGAYQELSILGFVKLRIKATMINFTWLLIQIFGLSVTWFLVFWAVKMTSIGGKIWGSLQKLWEKLLSTAEVIPLGSKSVGFGALKGVGDRMFTDTISEMDARRDATVSALLGDETAQNAMAAERYFNSQNTTLDLTNISNVGKNIETLALYSKHTAASHLNNREKLLTDYKTLITSIAGADSLTTRQRADYIEKALMWDFAKKYVAESFVSDPDNRIKFKMDDGEYELEKQEDGETVQYIFKKQGVSPAPTPASTPPTS